MSSYSTALSMQTEVPCHVNVHSGNAKLSLHAVDTLHPFLSLWGTAAEVLSQKGVLI